ncbi:hypothetical protein BRC92_10115 [Halobacteriales archaeon QS_4_69_31]|jgi:hypothetical protein|nr:MAG: hypothetical protein BRC92_10115 [Halobacteriales archaeon QS_4_69_31]
MDRADAVTALALVVGLVLVVVLEGLVRSLGFETLGLAVYPVGYGTLVVVAWYVWIRPLEFDQRPGPVWERDDDESN